MTGFSRLNKPQPKKLDDCKLYHFLCTSLSPSFMLSQLVSSLGTQLCSYAEENVTINSGAHECMNHCMHSKPEMDVIYCPGKNMINYL